MSQSLHSSHSASDARAAREPYAGPRDTVAATPHGDSPRAQAEPYVPPVWRTKPEPLPWISEFEPDAAIEAAAAGVNPGVHPVADGEVASDWPFEDAAAQASELSGTLSASDAPSPVTPEGGVIMPLPMWNDEDLMDIMPVRAAEPADRDPSMHWAALARTESSENDVAQGGANAGRASDEGAAPTASSESAARALEALARRVRGGELLLPGYVPELGDAAALAAALAALLGIRR